MNKMTLKLILMFHLINSCFARCFTGDPNNNGQTCTTNLVFEDTGVGSYIQCAVICLGFGDCGSVFYAASTSRCIGCKYTAATMTDLVPTADGQYFERTTRTDIMEYVGCYMDDQDRALSLYTFTTTWMTIDVCHVYCRDRDALFFALQNANTCYCGNSYDVYGPAINCTKACLGNSSQICGGSYANSVYTTYTYMC